MSVLSEIKNISQEVVSICPVCKFACRDRVDFIKVSEEGCCTECYTNFRYIIGKQWEKGVRPKVSVARSKMGFDRHN